MHTFRRFLYCLMLWSCFAHSEQQCVDEWYNNLQPKYSGDNLSSILDSWFQLETDCAEFDFYYLKLASLQAIAGDFDLAQSSYAKGLSLDGQYKPELELGAADLYFQRAVRNKSVVDLDLLAKANAEMESYIGKYPDSTDAFIVMSGIKLAIEDYQSSIDFAKKAIEVDDFPQVYRHMAVSYARLFKVDETIISALKAIQLNEAFKGDRDLMLALSMAYYEKGNVEYAFNVVQLLVKTKPELMNDPLVNKIGSGLQLKITQMEVAETPH